MAATSVNPHEQEYITSGIEQDIREDGRSRNDYRPFMLETGLVTNCSGSSRLQLGSTDVLVGVRVELAVPDSERPGEGSIQFSADCAASASPEFEKKGAAQINTELAHRLARMVCGSGCMDLTALCIIKGVQCWTLFVDVSVLLTGGNLFDAVGIAVLAALRTTQIPKITVISDGSEGPIEVQVAENPHDFTTLDTDALPLPVTITQIGGKHHVADVSASEEACMSAQVVVAVNAQGKTCMVQMGGGATVPATTLFAMVESGRRVGVKLVEKVHACLRAEQARGAEPLGFLA